MEIARPSATTIGELDILMRHLQATVYEIKSDMATKQDMHEIKRDVEEIKGKSDQYVTKTEFEALEQKVEDSSLSSSISKWFTLVTRGAAAITALIILFTAASAVVHFYDKVKM